MERPSDIPYNLVFLPASELPVLERIRRLSWQAFEDFMAEAYRRRGFHVEQMPRGRADGGYDLVLLRENASILVQCKHWLAYRVGVPRVRELAGAIQKVGATGGIFVTTDTFTPAAKQFANGMSIELVDGDALVRMLSDDAAQPPAGVPVAADGDAPTCPKCQKIMVWRTAGKGAHRGERFWGCPGYPRCKGIRQAA